MDPMEMELKQVAAGADQVTFRGLLMTADWYPDKDLLITEQHLEDAVAEFSEPIPLRVEHSPHGSIFDGRFGHLVRVFRQGKHLFGDVVVPRWFKTEVVGDRPFTVSTVWGRLSKKLLGLSTAMVPRVPDAQLHAMLSQGAPSRATWPTDAVVFAAPYDPHRDGVNAADVWLESRQPAARTATFTADPSAETQVPSGLAREARDGWVAADEWIKSQGGRNAR